jgi:4-amino-4-deoxy-L-arabinose transferase-like glycosyltransferase
MRDEAQRLPQVAAAVILAVFVLANARGLDSTPPVHQDEAWIAAPGVEFFTSGRFATQLFAGYYGSERHYYDFMPLHSLLDGAAIKLFGMSLVTVRAVSLTLATITLLLTYLVGRRLLSEWHGVLAMLMLASWPIAATGLPALQAASTGIPLTDLGRIGRYDILVPVFGLASLLAMLRALRERSSEAGSLDRAVSLTLAGVLAALATLSHYYGIVWLLVIATLIVASGGRSGLWLLRWPALGFALAMTPWVWFVTRDVGVFLAQKQVQAQNYFSDIASFSAQLGQYAPLLSAARRGHLASLMWIGLVSVGLVLLVRASLARQQSGARVLTITIAVMMTTFAVLVRPSYRYLGTVWPLFALTAAFAALHPWPARARALARGILVLLIAAASIQGAEAYLQMAIRARQFLPYSAVCDRITRHLPASARLLALQHWWLGIAPRVRDYRSFLVPVTRMNPRAGTPPVSFEAAMALDPMDYILIDPAMRDVLRSAGNPARPIAGPVGAEIAAFLRERAVMVDSFENTAYGRFTLYRVNMPDSALTR